MTTSIRPIVLITGGSRGLGKSMALSLAERGMDILLTYRQAASEAAAVVAGVAAAGGRAVALPLDVGARDGFGAFADVVRQRLASDFGGARLHALVNNAGTALWALASDTTPAQFDAIMQVHLSGPFFLTQALLPLIEDGGSILNVSTGLTRFALPGYSAYAMMKGGIEVWTRYLAKELGPRRIRVNVLAPGAIATDFGGGAVRDNKDLNAFIAGQTALGRVGEADDIGGAVAALLDPGAGWITGQRIEASGGMFL